MPKKLNTYVHVLDENGAAHQFGPDDELPGWAEKQITNKSVFEESEEAEMATPGPSQRTVFVEEAGEGPLEDRKVDQLRALAEANGIDASGNKSELVARLQEAGLDQGTNADTNVTA